MAELREDSSDSKHQNSEKKYRFSIYQGKQVDITSAPGTTSTNPDTAHLVCRITLKSDSGHEEASLEVIDEENLPIEIAIGTRKSKQLILFLKTRTIPENRQNLEHLLAPYGIAINDWIGKLRLIKGRANDDNYFIETEEI